MQILSDAPADLAQAAKLLQDGRIVAVPTETVYGLAADAFNPRACRAIFTAKARPSSDPLIVHIADLGELKRVAQPNEPARTLAEAFWPGPLTLVLRKLPAVPDIVTAKLHTVAVRCPRHPVMQKLLQTSGLCLAAPSANPFGYVSPTTAQHVIDSMGASIDAVIDGGPCPIGVESTILDLSDPRRPALLRSGAITIEALSERLQQPLQDRTREESLHPAAPGQLPSHYSPHTPLSLFPSGAQPEAQHGDAIVYFQPRPDSTGKHVHVLSPSGDLEEAARRLYSLLRELDTRNARHIWVETLPQSGIGIALNDRLRRAASKVS